MTIPGFESRSLGSDNKPEDDVTVIGIVKDVKFDQLGEEPVNLDYLSYSQRAWASATLKSVTSAISAPLPLRCNRPSTQLTLTCPSLT